MKKTTVLDGQTIEMLNKQLKVLEDKSTTAHNADIARAKALYKIKNEALYMCESNATDFKDWYNRVHDGTVYGITYKTACILINTYKNVWTVKEFNKLPLAVACRLASVCKDTEKCKAVKQLVADGKITPDTSQRATLQILKDNKLVIPKDGNKNGNNGSSNEDEVLEALAKINKYMKDNCKDKSILAHWDVIKEKLNK